MTEFSTSALQRLPTGFRCIDAHNLVIGPRFADALAGEFQPRSDPEFRMHTLGRLATAVFEMGEKEAPRWLRRAGAAQRIACIYRSPWAPTIVTRGTATTRGPILHLNTVRLEAPDGSFLEVSDQTHLAGQRIIVESSDLPVDSLVASDEKLGAIRESVATAAQKFFNDHS